MLTKILYNRCYSDMGTPRFGHPHSKTLVIWAPPSHITLAIWVRVRVTGDAHIIRGLEMGMPISLGFWEWGCPYH